MFVKTLEAKMEKFNGINIPPDTKIQSFKFQKIDNIDCKHEKWFWEGIKAESLIFCTKELKSTQESYLRTLVAKYLEEDNVDLMQITHKISGDYTYVNFNFKG